MFEESIMPAAGRHISSCRDIDTATIDSSVSSINIHPLRWLIRLSFSPTLPSALHYYLSSMVDLSRRSRRIRNLPRFFRLYLRVSIPSLPLRRLLRSISMPFRFDTRTGLRPGCCTSSVISTNDFAYITGIARCTSLGVLWKVWDSNRTNS